MERPYLRLPNNPGIMPTAELNEKYAYVLAEGETLQVGFTAPQIHRPEEWGEEWTIVFTDKRLIVERQWAESRFIDAIDSVESIVNEEHKSIPFLMVSGIRYNGVRTAILGGELWRAGISTRCQMPTLWLQLDAQRRTSTRQASSQIRRSQEEVHGRSRAAALPGTSQAASGSDAHR